MSKRKRNDPCTCGSGKKINRCCGENVIAFSTKSYNNELESLLEGLIDFAMTYFESTLVTHTQEYIEQNLREYDSDEIDAYVGLISAWLIFNKPIENGQTVFDLYYSRQKNKVKHIRTKRVFETWGNAEASVFEVISVEDKFSYKVTIRDVLTEKIYELTDTEATKDVIGHLLIGILLPFVQQNEFFFGALESPREENDFVFTLLEEFDANHMSLNESFPEFLAIVLDPPSDITLEWTDYNHELAAEIFLNHMLEKDIDKFLIEAGIFIWHVYCERQDPYIQKPESYAAALEYYIQRTIIKDTSVTQVQIAKEYGISAGTVSTNYRRILYELDDIDISNILQEVLEETQSDPSLPSEHPKPFNMERKMRNIEKLLEEEEFDSAEELDDFLNAILGAGDLPFVPETPREIAQDMIYEAEFEGDDEQKQLIEEALNLYPSLPEAYVLLAERETTPQKRHQLLQKAVEVGEKDLGSAFFKENKGHFWGIVRTRPYMRAKASYARSLDHMGQTTEAIEEFEEMLELNPNDNQGIRDILLPIYIEFELFEKALELIDRYKDDILATFMFNRALVSFHTEGINSQTYELFKRAHEQNPYVLDYLLKRKKVPNKIIDIIRLGDESEAIAYVQENIHLWEDAEELLKEFDS